MDQEGSDQDQGLTEVLVQLAGNWGPAGLAKLAYRGGLSPSGWRPLRRLVWAVLLGAAPGNSPTAWAEALEVSRRQYAELVEALRETLQAAEALLQKTAEEADAEAEGSSWWDLVAWPARLAVGGSTATTGEEEAAELLQEIWKDVERSLPDSEPESRLMLGRMLFHWCHSHNQTLPATQRYRQGMSDLAAVLQQVVAEGQLEEGRALTIRLCGREHAEADLYTLFSRLVDSGMWSMFAAHTGPGPESGPTTPILARCAYINDILLRAADQELYVWLRELKVEPQVFLLRWLRMLFSRELPMEQTLLLWDAIFADGYQRSKDYEAEYPRNQIEEAIRLEAVAASSALPLVDFVAVAMLRSWREKLLTADQTQCLMLLFKGTPSVSAGELIEAAQEVQEGRGKAKAAKRERGSPQQATQLEIRQQATQLDTRQAPKTQPRQQQQQPTAMEAEEQASQQAAALEMHYAQQQKTVVEKLAAQYGQTEEKTNVIEQLAARYGSTEEKADLRSTWKQLESQYARGQGEEQAVAQMEQLESMYEDAKPKSPRSNLPLPRLTAQNVALLEAQYGQAAGHVSSESSETTLPQTAAQRQIAVRYLQKPSGPIQAPIQTQLTPPQAQVSQPVSSQMQKKHHQLSPTMQSSPMLQSPVQVDRQVSSAIQSPPAHRPISSAMQSPVIQSRPSATAPHAAVVVKALEELPAGGASVRPPADASKGTAHRQQVTAGTIGQLPTEELQNRLDTLQRKLDRAHAAKAKKQGTATGSLMQEASTVADRVAALNMAAAKREQQKEQPVAQLRPQAQSVVAPPEGAGDISKLVTYSSVSGQVAAVPAEAAAKQGNPTYWKTVSSRGGQRQLLATPQVAHAPGQPVQQFVPAHRVAAQQGQAEPDKNAGVATPSYRYV